jgi:hypothetical protein
MLGCISLLVCCLQASGVAPSSITIKYIHVWLFSRPKQTAYGLKDNVRCHLTTTEGLAKSNYELCLHDMDQILNQSMALLSGGH